MPDRPDPDRRERNELADYASILHELHVELGRRATLMRDGADIPSGGISFGKRVGEGTSIAIQRFEDVAIHGQVIRQLAAVDAAIARLEAGTFGICHVCHQRIASDRLEAIPWADTCVACA